MLLISKEKLIIDILKIQKTLFKILSVQVMSAPKYTGFGDLAQYE